MDKKTIKTNLMSNMLIMEEKNILPICFCLFLFVSLLLSLYNVIFLYVSVVIAICYIIFFADERASYIIFFLIPLINIFNISAGGFNLLAVIFAFLTIKILALYFYKLISKQLKVNWFNIVCVAILCIYIFGFSFAELSRKFGIICGIVFLFSMQAFAGKIKLKDLAVFFFLGLCTAIFFGFLLPTSERLKSLIVLYSANGVIRFPGVSNPNFLVGELAICFSLFSYLFIKKEIGRFYYVIAAFLEAAALLTLSKSGFIVFLSVFLISLVFMLFKFKGKERLECIIFILVFSLVITCFNKEFLIIFNRYVGSGGNAGPSIPDSGDNIVDYSRNILGNNFIDYEVAFSSNRFCQILNRLTTGRFTLWLQFVIGICSSLKTFIFGFGAAAEDAVAIYNGEYLSAHNTFIQYFYYLGFVGIVLFVLILISILRKKKAKDFEILSLIPILSLLLFMFYDSMLSYRLCIFIYLIWNAMFYNKRTQQGENNYAKKYEIDCRCHANI